MDISEQNVVSKYMRGIRKGNRHVNMTTVHSVNVCNCQNKIIFKKEKHDTCFCSCEY